MSFRSDFLSSPQRLFVFSQRLFVQSQTRKPLKILDFRAIGNCQSIKDYQSLLPPRPPRLTRAGRLAIIRENQRPGTRSDKFPFNGRAAPHCKTGAAPQRPAIDGRKNILRERQQRRPIIGINRIIRPYKKAGAADAQGRGRNPATTRKRPPLVQRRFTHRENLDRGGAGKISTRCRSGDRPAAPRKFSLNSKGG